MTGQEMNPPLPPGPAGCGEADMAAIADTPDTADTAAAANSRTELATFAGGCFWCMVKPFDELPGIVSVVSGYTGGRTANPTYEEVGTETTGHYEAVRIVFDPERFPYERLLGLYWQQIDPTDAGGQFLDRGSSYRTAIFVHGDRQRELAEKSKREIAASGRFSGRIVTEILPAGPFYPAEPEHQHYYKHRPFDYKLYLKGSGRADYLEARWNRREDRERLRRTLTPLEYDVTQNRGMEPPFDNAYWNNRRPGVYVDLITGDPLFASADQYEAGDGWPAFRRPLAEGRIRREADLRPGMPRTGLRSRLSGAWLGHLLYDGPAPDGLHYRVNSAALRFIPADGELHEEERN